MANRAYLNAMMAQEPLGAHDGIKGREQRGAIVNLSSGLGVISMPKNRTPHLLSFRWGLIISLMSYSGVFGVQGCYYRSDAE